MKEIIKFVEFEKKNLAGYTLIEGFPGMGLVSTIATKYIIEKADFKEFGYLDTNIFFPIIRVHNGRPLYPARIYINEKKKLVALIAEQLIPKVYAYNLAKEIVKWIKKKKIKRLISLEGIQTADAKISEPKIYGIAANERSRKFLEKYKIELVRDGITTGQSALILLGLHKTDIEAVSLLVNVKLTADYEASAALIKTLNEILGLKIDVEPLLEEARETEKALLEQLQRMKKTTEAVEKFEDGTPMYT